MPAIFVTTAKSSLPLDLSILSMIIVRIPTAAILNKSVTSSKSPPPKRL